MAFNIDDLEETLGLQEIPYDNQYLEEDEFADIYEDEMEEEFEEIMMGGNKGLLEEVIVVANGNPSERKLIIMSGGMNFIYEADKNLSFRLFDMEENSLFTMSYYWNDMVEK